MNLKTLLLFVFAFAIMQTAYASFPVQRTAETTEASNQSTTNASEKLKKDAMYAPAMGSEKSQGIALILALVLGLLAAHRWYLNRPWPWNIMFIFTLGGFGIWLLIDIIRICTGDLGPAKGRYKKEFF